MAEAKFQTDLQFGAAADDFFDSTATTMAAETLKASTVNGLKRNNVNGRDQDSRLSLQRSSSSPMMPAFMVSAPGKVIVFGEHAVVHGKVCIILDKQVYD